jgi:hypothetical protein
MKIAHLLDGRLAAKAIRIALDGRLAAKAIRIA